MSHFCNWYFAVKCKLPVHCCVLARGDMQYLSGEEACVRRGCVILQATIDQVEGLIFFDSSSQQLLQWDLQIQAVCNQLNVIVEDLVSKDAALQA